MMMSLTNSICCWISATVFLLLVTVDQPSLVTAIDNESIFYPLLMPDVQPRTPESYLCTAFKMPRNEHQFIVEYLPKASKMTAHHILIYGCEAPAYNERDTPRAVWDCGEMAPHNNDQQIFPRAGICKGESQIVYSWAMDAPSLKLPNGVGFKVGKGTGINHLVLQVHYAHVDSFLNGATDHSGIVLRMLPQDNSLISKLAGVLLMVTNGRIEPQTTEKFETACQLDESISIHPFAFRTHTHKLGKVVAGYRIKPQTGEWEQIGKGNPQLPQMFYKIAKQMTIEPGDLIAARCTMHNNQTHTVSIGATGNDEMCNFYIMYYVDRMDHILDRKVCYTAGPPGFYWRHLMPVPERIDQEASIW